MDRVKPQSKTECDTNRLNDISKNPLATENQTHI